MRPQTAQDKADIVRTSELDQQGNAALDAKDYITAEQDFREALDIAPWDVSYDQGLAEALTGQGRIKEAIDAYRLLVAPYPHFITSVADELRTRMRFAILLAQTGQWAEAVANYEKSVLQADFGTSPEWRPDFDPQVPQPQALEAMAHIALGRDYTMSTLDHRKAFVEFSKAQQVQPKSPLANYYYGFGWQQLSPAERAKFGSPEKARAALETAARLGKGQVKVAAQKALKVALLPE